MTPRSCQYSDSVIGPSLIRPTLTGRVSIRPMYSIKAPGTNVKKSTPYTNMARRLIQAAFHGENQPSRLWWLTPTLAVLEEA